MGARTGAIWVHFRRRRENTSAAGGNFQLLFEGQLLDDALEYRRRRISDVFVDERDVIMLTFLEVPIAPTNNY